MTYTPQIYLTKEQEDNLKVKLIFEISNHRGERSAWVDDLKRFQSDYIANPRNKSPKFPFVGAATIVIPLTAIVTEALHARNMQRMFGGDQLVAGKFFDDFWNQFDRPIERFLDWQLLEQIGFKSKFENCLLELEKLGTAVMKDGYSRITKFVKVNGAVEEVPIYAGPDVMPVPVANFLMPFACQDPQTADWCGEEHVSTQYGVLLAEQSGLFRPGIYQKLANFYSGGSNTNLSSDPYRQNIQKETNQQPVWPKEIGWYEIYIAWDVTETNPEGVTPPDAPPPQRRELQVLYDYNNNEILAIRDNPDPFGRRPYEIGVMMKLENRWTGIGVAKQNEQFQREVTMQHRQRLDAGTLANANMLKVQRLSGVSPDEPVYPGKLLFLDNLDDVEPLQLGGTYPAASNNEQQTLYYAQQRSGINELTLGQPQSGTPGTATENTIAIQESGLRFDYTSNNVKDFANRIILNTICNISLYGCSDPRYFDIIPEGAAVKEFFKLPVSLHRSHIIAKFSVINQSQNKLLDRNNWTQLSQFFTQYYQNAVQGLLMIGKQDLAAAAILKGIDASTKAMKMILESFDIPNPTALTLEDLLRGLIPAVPGPGGQNAGGNIGPGASPPIQIAPTVTTAPGG